MSTHAPSLPPLGRPACVLLADDDAEMRRLLARGLRKWGYLVVEAHDGNQLGALLDALVLDALGAHHVDVVVADIRMPGPSGIELLAKLRSRDRATPMILMTAFGDPALHAEARRLGASAVFDKPFDLDDLCTAVVNLVSPAARS